ncbi:MAG TPA: hypothetical protein VGR72_10265 [Candidatus Acidoferrales bacterium]|nr:hypothetical protein [Candidatus Acidoferrales bacterium]
MAETSPIPTLLAFIVCDTVIHDVGTQKKTLVGVFDIVHSPIVPFVINSVGLYAKMVEGAGPYTVKVRMVNLKDESPLMEVSANAAWNTPEDPLELGMNFQGLPIPEFGTYEFQLFANDIYLGRALIRARKMEMPPAAPPGGK